MRLALMFLIQRRRHYDKATLCQLSDFVHQKSLAIPNLLEILEHSLNELTEKKSRSVSFTSSKVTSILQVMPAFAHFPVVRSLPPNATAAQVQEAARALNVKRFEEDFCAWFCTLNPRGRGVRNLQELSDQAAEFLLDLFILVRQNLSFISAILPPFP